MSTLTSMKYFTTLAILFGLTASSLAAEPHVYRVARLWPGDGPVIIDAVLVVRDGKILAVGKSADIKILDDAVIHELGDSVLIPGLVIAETNLADRGRDDLLTMTPHYRASDAFDPYADYSRQLSGGVTTVQLSPGNKRLLPGQGSVVKLAGADVAKRTLREEESMRLVLGDSFKNPPRVYEPPVGAVSVERPLEQTRPQLAGSLQTAMAGLRATFQTARTDRTAASADPVLRALADAGSAKKPLRVFAPGSGDVQAALDLAQAFDLRLVLVEPVVGSSDRLKTWKSHVDGVVLSPGTRPGAVSDSTGNESVITNARRRRQPVASLKSAAIDDDAGPASLAEAAKDLRAAGFRVALKTVQDADLKEMLYLGGLFTTQLTSADALRMLTSDSAALLGVADRVGSLASGKDADFVVLSADPFDLHTRVRSVYVEGKPVLDNQTRAATKVIRADRVLTGAGESLSRGSVLVEGKTIRAVGSDVAVPHDAQEMRFENAVIVPGFLDLANGIGVGGPLNTPVPLNTKLGARLVTTESAASGVRQSGITTVLLSSDTTNPTPVLAFKLGDRLRPVKDPVAVKLTMRGNLTQAGPQLRESLKTGKAYYDSWVKYEAELSDYERKKKEYDARPKPVEKKPEEKKADDKKPEDKKPEEKKPDEKKPEEKKPEEKKPEEKKSDEPKAPTKPQLIETLEPIRDLFAGKLPALVDAKREDAIRLAITICRDEFNLQTVLLGADDAWRIADLLEAKRIAVAAGPQLVRTIDRNEVNLPLALSMRSVPFGFQSQATTGAKQLPSAVGFAVRQGLGAEEALRGLTSAPAKFLKLDSIGEIAAGKDADLVVLSGMPFELSTRVLAVMIDGQWVYRESE